VEGRVPVGRPRKIWDEVLRKGLESKGTDRLVAFGHVAWQAAIRWQRLTHVNIIPAFKNDDDNDFVDKCRLKINITVYVAECGIHDRSD